MNTNFFQTILTILMTLSGLATSILVTFGCTTLPNGTVDCAANTAPTWLAPYLVLAATILGFVKIVLAAFEGKLTKPTVPVSK